MPWDAVDMWLEEGRRLVHYPPNPYHRVDCRPTNRRLRVSVAGATLVDTVGHGDRVRNRAGASPLRRAVGRPHRHVAANRDQQLLQLQGLRDVLGGGGGGTVVDDVAWSYEDPPPECLPIKGYLSFDAARADVLAELPASGRAAGLRLRGVTRITDGVTSHPTVPSP